MDLLDKALWTSSVRCVCAEGAFAVEIVINRTFNVAASEARYEMEFRVGFERNKMDIPELKFAFQPLDKGLMN